MTSLCPKMNRLSKKRMRILSNKARQGPRLRTSFNNKIYNAAASPVPRILQQTELQNPTSQLANANVVDLHVQSFECCSAFRDWVLSDGQYVDGACSSPLLPECKV